MRKHSPNALWLVLSTCLFICAFTASVAAQGTQTFSYTGPAIAVPDSNTTGVTLTLPVSGITGNISDLNFRFDALTGCDGTIGNTNAAMDHTFTGDLVFRLTSPQGTTVIIVNQAGGNRNNICTTLLDDDGGFPSLSTITSVDGLPISGNYAPSNPLSAFDGQNPNGNWTLNVRDVAAADTGSMRRFSLVITPSVATVSTQSFSYAGPAVAVPDANVTGVNLTLPVSGITNTISDLNFRFDALAGCDGTIGNTNAAMTHTFLQDLVFRLTSPQGTTVTIVNRIGGDRNNFCSTLLDDDGGFPNLNTIGAGNNLSVSGSYEPSNPLSAFDGENPNGNWTLNVSDVALQDTGSMRRFSLIFTPNVVTAANVSVFGRVLNHNGRGLYNATVILTDQSGQTIKARTNPFGFYRFTEIAAGQTYIISAKHKSYTFDSRVMGANEELQNVDFTPNNPR